MWDSAHGRRRNLRAEDGKLANPGGGFLVYRVRSGVSVSPTPSKRRGAKTPPGGRVRLVALDDELGAPAPPGPTSGSSDPRWMMPLDDLRSRSARTLGEPSSSTVAKRNVYQRSDDLKVYVLRRADGVCEGCEQPAPFLTIAGRP
jgi:hypothetical protein